MTFLGLDEHGNKLHTEIPLENEDVPCGASCKSEKNESKRARKSSARLSTQQKQSLEKNLKKSMQEVRARCSLTQKNRLGCGSRRKTRLKVGLICRRKGSSSHLPCTNNASRSAQTKNKWATCTTPSCKGEIPRGSHFLYEFLFADEAPRTRKMVKSKTSNPIRAKAAIACRTTEIWLSRGVQKPALFEPTLDEQLNGNAYVFHGSLVMGWIEIPALRSESSWRNGTVSFPTIYNRKRCRAEVKSLTRAILTPCCTRRDGRIIWVLGRACLVPCD